MAQEIKVRRLLPDLERPTLAEMGLVINPNLSWQDQQLVIKKAREEYLASQAKAK